MVSRTGFDITKKGQAKAEKAQAKTQKATDEKKALMQENKKLMKELAALRKQAVPVDSTTAEPKLKRARAKKNTPVDGIAQEEALPIPDNLDGAIDVLKCSVTECEETAEPTITAACKHAFCSLHGPHCSNHIGHPLSSRINPCVVSSDESDDINDPNVTVQAEEATEARGIPLFLFSSLVYVLIPYLLSSHVISYQY